MSWQPDRWEPVHYCAAAVLLIVFVVLPLAFLR